ncbi:MAG: hypothetical protein CMH57_08015 [Myxococcales bacterium]|nr:hypothetical protein [Myxococcales bacterium]
MRMAPGERSLTPPWRWCLIALTTLGVACAPVEPPEWPDTITSPAPQIEPPEQEPAAPAEDRAPGWTWHERDDLKLRFKLPEGWRTEERNGMLFALPRPPADDAAIVFVRAADQEEVADVLAWLDDVFPMTQVKYTRQSEQDSLNGMRAVFGEGSGRSSDINDELYFLIVLLELDEQYTLVATYIPEAVFAQRSPVFGEIIKSVEPSK